MINTFSLPLGGHIENAVAPADIGAAAATGSFANMESVENLYIYGCYAAGAAGNGPVVAVEQASDGSGTGTVALAISEIWTKVGSGAWTRVAAVNRQATVATYDTDGVGGDDEAVEIVVRVNTDDMTDGKTHVRVNTPAAGGNRDGAWTYICMDRKYRGKVTPAL